MWNAKKKPKTKPNQSKTKQSTTTTTKRKCVKCESHSVVSNSLWSHGSHGILQARILEWVSVPFSRGTFPTQGSNSGLPHCRGVLYKMNYQESLKYMTRCSSVLNIRRFKVKPRWATTTVARWKWWKKSSFDEGTGYLIHFKLKNRFGINRWAVFTKDKLIPISWTGNSLLELPNKNAFIWLPKDMY